MKHDHPEYDRTPYDDMREVGEANGRAVEIWLLTIIGSLLIGMALGYFIAI